MKTGVNQLTTILAAAGIISLSVLYFNISPVAVGAAADHRGFSNQQLGMLMVPGMCAKVLISLLLSFWVRRINRKLLLFGGACAFFGYIFAAFTTSYTILLIALGIAGVGTGIFYCISTMDCVLFIMTIDGNHAIYTVLQRTFLLQSFVKK